MKLLDPYLTQKCKIYLQNAIFYNFEPLKKSVFELTNLKFSFSESGPGSVHIPLKLTFLSQIQQENL